jgi:hypothetical protein
VYSHHNSRQEGDGGARNSRLATLPPGHARQLAQRLLGIGHVAQQVGERQRVEGGIGEGQLFGPADDQSDAVGPAGRRDVALALPQHLFGQVHSDDARRGTRRELQRHARGSRRHVQNRTRPGRDDLVDHGPPPARVLPEGQ